MADVVQDVWGAAELIRTNSPVGQTFQAIDPVIHTVSLGITSMNPGEEEFGLTVMVYGGAGLNGTLLATSVVEDVFIGPHGWVDFTLPTPIAVQVGQVYTFQLLDDSWRWGIQRASHNPYAQGNAVLDGVTTAYDLRFRIFAAARPGACCVASECLQDVDQATCASAKNGVHAGTGSYCADGVCVPGACCDDRWGDCAETVEVECQAYFVGRGVGCEEIECVSYRAVCCIDGSCEHYVRLHECKAARGLWHGPDAYCYEYECPACFFGDLDGDGDVDLLDVASLQGCFGRDVPACACGDFDGRAGVADDDAAALIGGLSGPD